MQSIGKESYAVGLSGCGFLRSRFCLRAIASTASRIQSPSPALLSSRLITSVLWRTMDILCSAREACHVHMCLPCLRARFALGNVRLRARHAPVRSVASELGLPLATLAAELGMPVVTIASELGTPQCCQSRWSSACLRCACASARHARGDGLRAALNTTNGAGGGTTNGPG